MLMNSICIIDSTLLPLLALLVPRTRGGERFYLRGLHGIMGAENRHHFESQIKVASEKMGLKAKSRPEGGFYQRATGIRPRSLSRNRRCWWRSGS